MSIRSVSSNLLLCPFEEKEVQESRQTKQKFIYRAKDGKEYRVFTNPEEWLLGGGSRCCSNCCFSCCSFADERNDPAFAYIGKIICCLPAFLCCLFTCGTACNICCIPHAMADHSSSIALRHSNGTIRNSSMNDHFAVL